MVLARMQAGGEGVQPLQPVRQTVLHQELQRPIRNRGLAPEAFGRQPVQHLIGAHRAMRLEQDLERPPPDGRQPGTGGRDACLGGVKGVGLAFMVVMRREGGVGRGLGLAQGM